MRFGMTNFIARWYNAQTPAALRVSAYLLLGLVGILDYATGTDLSFSIFYLIPISVAAWGANQAHGRFVAVISGAVWLFDEYSTSLGRAAHFAIYWNAGVHLGFFWIVNELLTAVKRAYERERLAARTDYLTKTANKRHFYETLAVELERARRYGHPMTLVYLDADNFKAVNDQRGHEAGDDVLRAIGTTLTAETRSLDLAARLGGDEFAVLMPELDGPAAQATVRRLKERLDAAMAEGGWPVGFSVGVASFAEAPASTAAALKAADQAMYAAKRGGKNRIVVGAQQAKAASAGEAVVTQTA